MVYSERLNTLYVMGCREDTGNNFVVNYTMIKSTALLLIRPWSHTFCLFQKSIYYFTFGTSSSWQTADSNWDFPEKTTFTQGSLVVFEDYLFYLGAVDYKSSSGTFTYMPSIFYLDMRLWSNSWQTQPFKEPSKWPNLKIFSTPSYFVENFKVLTFLFFS